MIGAYLPESAPEERREVENDPTIFLIDELTPAAVNVHAYNSAKPGDDGIRMNFGVYFSAGGDAGGDKL